MNVINSFTLEASFCGSDVSEKGAFQFNTVHLLRMGFKFGETLYHYFFVQGATDQNHDKNKLEVLNNAIAFKKELLEGIMKNDKKFSPEIR